MDLRELTQIHSLEYENEGRNRHELSASFQPPAPFVKRLITVRRRNRGDAPGKVSQVRIRPARDWAGYRSWLNPLIRGLLAVSGPVLDHRAIDLLPYVVPFPRGWDEDRQYV